MANDIPVPGSDIPLPGGGGGAATLPSTLILADATTVTPPDLLVLRHTTSGTAGVGFGATFAVELQNDGSAHAGVGQVKRVMNDDTSFVIATDGAEEVRRNIAMIVSGASQKWGALGYLVNGNNPMLYLGDPATPIGLCRIPGASAMQVIYSSAVMQFASGLVTSLSRHLFSARMQQSTGAGIASATTVTLGADGNVFPITGTTTINGLTTATWAAGATVYLKFAGILVVTNNSGAPGGGAVAIKTSTAANVTTAANSIMTLQYDGTFWVQTCPITVGY